MQISFPVVTKNHNFRTNVFIDLLQLNYLARACSLFSKLSIHFPYIVTIFLWSSYKINTLYTRSGIYSTPLQVSDSQHQQWRHIALLHSRTTHTISGYHGRHQRDRGNCSHTTWRSTANRGPPRLILQPPVSST